MRTISVFPFARACALFRACLSRGVPALVLTALLALAACQERLAVRGNLVETDELAEIEDGDLTRETVRDILGTPSTRRMLRNEDEGETWLYIGERTRQITFRDTEVLERLVLAIHFDTDGFVDNSEILDLSAGREIIPRAKTTPTPGRQFTIIQQFLGNVGRFNTPEGARTR